MKKIFRSTLIVCILSMLLSATVFASGEKSLIKDTEDLFRSYGNAFKITEEHREIIDAIKATGKSDFKEGIYADFFPSIYGPPVSEQYLEIEDIKDYDKLVFDICSLSQEKFKDLEAFIYWNLFEDEDLAPNYTAFKEEFFFTTGTNDEFKIEKIDGGEYPELNGIVQILITDKEWNYKYAITASNEWETVELDIRDLDGMTFLFSIQDSASVLVANPRLVKEQEEKPVEPGQAEVKLIANPTNATVLVNGNIVEFDAYSINNNNYFKLRDLAKVLSGTEKQFEVTWDESIKAINLISNKAYTPVGGELTQGDGKIKETKETTATIYKDGEIINLTAYNINGNNYFKLRDIGQAFNFNIGWNQETRTITIDTSLGYTAE